MIDQLPAPNAHEELEQSRQQGPDAEDQYPTGGATGGESDDERNGRHHADESIEALPGIRAQAAGPAGIQHVRGGVPCGVQHQQGARDGEGEIEAGQTGHQPDPDKGHRGAEEIETLQEVHVRDSRRKGRSSY